MRRIYQITKEKGIEDDINRWRDSGDDTIIMCATTSGRPNVIKLLIEELQFDVNEKNCAGYTALHVAAFHSNIDCARVLVDLGSQHLEDLWDNTPLDYARRNGLEEISKLLKSHYHFI